MQRVKISIQDELPQTSESCWLLLPRPINDWQQRYLGMELNRVAQISEVKALNSEQHAFLLKPASACPPQIEYRFEPGVWQPSSWIWQQQDNRHTRAADDLVELARTIVGPADDRRTAIQRLIEHAAEIFGYGHRDNYLYEEKEEISTFCGVAKGSCVDINTYVMAAARSLDIPVQYLAGYWIHPQKNKTHDMHCWLVFQVDGEPLFWDLAHHLKWGVEKLAPGLNPAGGRRVPMSCGRGLCFPTPHGEVEISHFAEPVWILPDARKVKPQLQIEIQGL